MTETVPTIPTTTHPTLQPTVHPTPEARTLHLAHLATTHRAPLVDRSSQRGRASSFSPMARDHRSLRVPPRPISTHEA